MKRIIALSFLMLAAVAACAQVKYVAGYYSSDGTGHVGTFNPVSYTHLDVYKRQWRDCRNRMFRGKHYRQRLHRRNDSIWSAG